MAIPEVVDEKSFAYRDLLSIDRWDSFTPTFTSLEAAGTTSYSGRLRIVGKSCQFQVTLRASTAIRSSGGEAYMVLPIAARGLNGIGTMSNVNTNISVGVCHVDVTNSRLYLPAQVSSSATFALAGWYEIE